MKNNNQRSDVPKALLACLAMLFLWAGMVPISYANDWPTYMHDSARSGVSPENLSLPLSIDWSFFPRQEPDPAWPAPAKEDRFRRIRDLMPVVTYDRAYQVVAMQGRVFFGTSSNDKVYCLNADTGEIEWTFFAEGPVRLAPSIAEGKVYFGSDDGRVYCLDAESGKELWRYRPDQPERLIAGNERVVSFRPVRSGVIVDNNIVYGLAGLFPSHGVFAYALDSHTGRAKWCRQMGDISPQGYLVGSDQWLFAPTGRTNPAVINRRTGDLEGRLSGGGGAFAVLVDDVLASGPGVRHSERLTLSDPESKEVIATCDGHRMIVSEGISYMQTRHELMALDRRRFIELGRARTELVNQRGDNRDDDRMGSSTKQTHSKENEEESKELSRRIAELDKKMNDCYLWRISCAQPYSLILAGNALFAGGNKEVVAFDTTNGQQQWKGTFQGGRAYGLSVAQGRLFVSTEAGTIHCFTSSETKQRIVEEEVAEKAPYSRTASVNRYAELAEFVLEQSGTRKGYCVVLNSGRGELAYELAMRSDLQLICLERDSDRVDESREILDSVGLYGKRIVVRHWKRDGLQFTSWFANLVVSLEAPLTHVLPVEAPEVYRVLRPYGGKAFMHSAAGDSEPDSLRGWLDKVSADEEGILEDKGKWAYLERKEPDGAGSWTQLYADEGHTACSGDKLQGPLTVQWFGEPGPRGMVDRHRMPMAPLLDRGRLFIPGEEVVYAVDPYNGTPLWELDVSGVFRKSVNKGSGHMLLTEDRLYIAAENQCWAVQLEDGKQSENFKLDELGDADSHWGYLNRAGGLLIGSGEAQSAYVNYSRKAILIDAFVRSIVRPIWPIGGVFVGAALMLYVLASVLRIWKGRFLNAPEGARPTNTKILVSAGVCFVLLCSTGLYSLVTLGKVALSLREIDRPQMVSSRYLFAVDRHTGKKAWNYKRGEILNSAIAIEGERVVFIEKRHAASDFDEDGRIDKLSEFLAEGTWLVAAETKSGKVVWEEQVTVPYDHIIYLQAERGIALVSGAYNEEGKSFYRLLAYDIEDGSALWTQEFRARNLLCTDWAGLRNNHNDLQQRPVIVGDRIFARPYGFNLETGKQLDYEALRGGHGCGGLAGSTHYLFGRGDFARMYPLAVKETQGEAIITVARPGCSLNLIPASGIVVMPEATAGCTCLYPLQTSFGFIPESVL